MTSADRVAVIGTGMMGTSIAHAAARTGDAVWGYDADAAVLERSASRAGFEAASSLQACVRDADLVFVCTPIADIATSVAEALVEAPLAVVTDVGSVKSHVVREVEERAGRGLAIRFVGGHPMGGSERSGPEAASAAVLDGIAWVLTPTPRTEAAAVRRVEAWVAKVGSEPIRMEPEQHDRLVAMISHLPQVASTALMGLAGREEASEPEILLLAAGGFRDLTRLAASSPELWSDILLANREAVMRAIDLYVDRLRVMRNLVRDDRSRDLQRTLAEAKRGRLSLAAKPQVRSGIAVIQVPVPDRPGALAELTASLGAVGVNIEDLQIVHSPEGGRGTVHLTVAASSAGAATDAIERRGFPAFRLA